MEKIIVIGANSHQTPLIKKVQENGYEAHVFAWQMREPGEYMADHFYPISITEYKRIMEQCKLISPAATLTICSDLTAGTVAILTEGLGLTGNSMNIVHNCVDKILMKKLVADAGIKQPNYQQSDDILNGSSIENINYPVIVKPADRSGGRGVRKVNNQAELIEAISIAKDFSFSKTAIVEEYIEGTSVRAECISYAGQHYVLSITLDEIIYVNDAFIEKSHCQSSEITSTYKELLEKKATSVLDAVGYKFGASSAEFIVDKNNEAYLIEVNASMCGDFVGTHLVPLSTGYDFLQATIDVSLGKELELPVLKKGKTAKVSFILSKSDYKQLDDLRKTAPEKIILDSNFTNFSILPENNSKYRYGYYVSVED